MCIILHIFDDRAIYGPAWLFSCKSWFLLESEFFLIFHIMATPEISLLISNEITQFMHTEYHVY